MKVAQPGNDERLSSDLGKLWGSVASRGLIRTTDGKALSMIPEANEITPDKFKELKEQGKIDTTWRRCGNCGVQMKIQHTKQYDLNRLSPCPCCNAQDWQEIEFCRT